MTHRPPRDTPAEMLDLHLTEEELAWIAEGYFTAEEDWRITVHLFLCPMCLARLALSPLPDARRVVEVIRRRLEALPEEEPLGEEELEAALARGLEQGRGMAGEREVAGGRLSEVLAVDPPRRLLLVANRRELCRLSIAEGLVASIEEEGLWHDDPAEAVGRARLALEVLERLPPGRYPEPAQLDVRVQALASLGNGLRVQGQLRQAVEAFQELHKVAPHSIADPELQARAVELEGSLCMDRRRFAEALERFERAAAAYRELADTTGEVRTEVQRAIAYGLEQRHEAAIAVLGTALDRCAEESLPRELQLCALQSLATYLTEAGRAFEARRYLGRLRTLATGAGQVDRLKVRWVEAMINHGLGRYPQAREGYDDAREGFTQLGLGHFMARVTLDLAILLLDRGDLVQVRQLALDAGPVFEALGIEREALAALRLFVDAARRQEATVELARRLARYLPLAAADPGYPFPG